MRRSSPNHPCGPQTSLNRGAATSLRLRPTAYAAAQLVVGALVGPAGFFWQQPEPLGMLATSTLAHLVFGLTLTLAYEA